MRRMKKHKVKKEKPETSTSVTKEQEDHDLAFYIHDRVELMHQVFSVLKYKELMAIAPDCIRHISINDLQELCTEELLGISSKRLCATLDGADPPSDTESSSQSSPEQLETISLDSISSDEGMLSGSGKKKKHKHRRRDSKSKSKHRTSESQPEETDKCRASRAGLTVLELLELQARARAIRAQLQQEQAAKCSSDSQPVETSTHMDDDHHSDVEIKEEPAEVVEISSDEEKPNVQELDAAAGKPPQSLPSKEPEKSEASETITKRVNDLIITVPQAKPTRKIKLNRNKVITTVPNVQKKSDNVASETRIVVAVNKDSEVVKPKKKQKKKGKRKSDAKEGSDHDEITLQLSDSEKMDLLEDLDRKVYDSVSSSEDSESSSSDDDDDDDDEKVKERKRLMETEKAKVRETLKVTEREKQKKKEKEILVDKKAENKKESRNGQEKQKGKKMAIEIEASDSPKRDCKVTVLDENLEIDNVRGKEISKTIDESVTITEEADKVCIIKVNNENRESVKENNKPNEVVELAQQDLDKLMENTESELTISTESNKEQINTESTQVSDAPMQNNSSKLNETEELIVISTVNDIPIKNDETKASTTNTDTDAVSNNHIVSETERAKDRSDGEVSDRDSSEVEAVNVKLEVVCISDEEHNKQKKKKKDKKKKVKKSKKTKSDFREGADQNFYRDTDVDSIDNDVYEILELSDDSSCYEVEGTVLSKEPTAEEIAALSAKIDEIDREEVVTEEQIRNYESSEIEKSFIADESISWKDRYLESRKVKRVLSTANIFNALRKKNKELKIKMEESKREIPKGDEEVAEKVTNNLEEGSIEQYNTLQGSNKYVDPIPEVTEHVEKKTVNISGESQNSVAEKEGPITTEMKKDAKQLLKMYKRLLKYNNIHKEKHPTKKKKKKQKKNKDQTKDGVNACVAIPEVTSSV